MSNINQGALFFIFISVMGMIGGFVSFRYWKKGYGAVVANSGWKKVKKYEIKTFLSFSVFIPPKEASVFEKLTLLGLAIGSLAIGFLALAIGLNILFLN